MSSAKKSNMDVTVRTDLLASETAADSSDTKGASIPVALTSPLLITAAAKAAAAFDFEKTAAAAAKQR
jgi:hypothetical protein